MHLKIITKASWNSAPLGTEIKVKLVVTGEGNWPEHNADGHVKAHYTYEQCEQGVQIDVSATKIEWQVIKPGTYVTAEGIKFTIKSNGEIDIKFIASNLVNSSGSEIEIWYAVGDNLEAAETFGWKKSFTISLDPTPPYGVTIRLWGKIKVEECDRACEYENNPTIIVYPKA